MLLVISFSLLAEYYIFLKNENIFHNLPAQMILLAEKFTTASATFSSFLSSAHPTPCGLWEDNFCQICSHFSISVTPQLASISFTVTYFAPLNDSTKQSCALSVCLHSNSEHAGTPKTEPPNWTKLNKWSEINRPRQKVYVTRELFALPKYSSKCSQFQFLTIASNTIYSTVQNAIIPIHFYWGFHL